MDRRGVSNLDKAEDEMLKEAGQAGVKTGGLSEVIRCPRHQLVAALVEELLDFFDEPRASGRVLSELQASLIVGQGIDRAVEGGCQPK